MVQLNLVGVETACQKPECKASGRLDRHHKRHQALFVRWFYHLKGTARYERFCARYHSFHPDDVVLVCPEHHQEIHYIYRRIIRRHVRRVGRPLSSFSWNQARILMRAMEDACLSWLKLKTPGRRWENYQRD